MIKRQNSENPSNQTNQTTQPHQEEEYSANDEICESFLEKYGSQLLIAEKNGQDITKLVEKLCADDDLFCG